LLWRRSISITADGYPYSAVVRAIRSAGRLAAFDASVIDRSVATVLEETTGRTAVAVSDVTVLALLRFGKETVTAFRAAEGATLSALGGPGRLARLQPRIVHHTVATELEQAARGAAISVGLVTIFALLGRREVPVAAKRRAVGAHIGTRSGPGRLARLGPIPVDDAITAEFERAA
jgi:hypothetical protein